jgi:hypothetical protein
VAERQLVASSVQVLGGGGRGTLQRCRQLDMATLGSVFTVHWESVEMNTRAYRNNNNNNNNNSIQFNSIQFLFIYMLT